MGKVSKSLSLLVIVTLAVSSILAIQPTYAQAIPKPSVPDFTLKYVDSSTYIQPVYSTDQYTGKSVITQEGYYQQNKSLILTIANLPFTKALQNQNLTILYQIGYKGSYGSYWVNFNESSSNCGYASSEGHLYLIYPNAPNTVVTLSFNGNNGSARYGATRFIDNISDGGQIDFHVRAFIGYFTKVYEYDKYVPGVPVDDPTDPVPHYYAFTGEASSWSSIQTISIPDGAVITSNNPSPTMPELSWLALLPLCLIVLAVVLLLKRPKHGASPSVKP